MVLKTTGRNGKTGNNSNNGGDGKVRKKASQRAQDLIDSNPVSYTSKYLESIDRKIEQEYYGITSTHEDKEIDVNASKSVLSTQELKDATVRIEKAFLHGRAWECKKKESPKDKNNLLNIPAELRLSIYDAILDSRDIIVIESTGQSSRDGKERQKIPPYGQLIGLCLACTQTWHEMKDYIASRPSHITFYPTFGPINLRNLYFIVKFPWKLASDNFSSELYPTPQLSAATRPSNVVYMYHDDRDDDAYQKYRQEVWDFGTVKYKMAQLKKRPHEGIISEAEERENEFLLFKARTLRDLFRMWVWVKVMGSEMCRRDFNTQAKRFVRRNERAKALLRKMGKEEERCFGYRFEQGYGYFHFYTHWGRGFGTFERGTDLYAVPTTPRWEKWWADPGISKLFEIEDK